ASRNRTRVEGGNSGLTSKSTSDRLGSFPGTALNEVLAETNSYSPVPQPTVPPDDPLEGEDEDPDLPPGMAGKIDKEAYLRARGDYIDMLRGREGEVPEDAREKAVRQMERQEAQVKRTKSNLLSSVNTTDWSF